MSIGSAGKDIDQDRSRDEGSASPVIIFDNNIPLYSVVVVNKD